MGTKPRWMVLWVAILAGPACDVEDSGSRDTAREAQDDAGGETVAEDGSAPDVPHAEDGTVPDVPSGDTPADVPAELSVDGPVDGPADVPEDVPPLDPTCGVERGNTSRAELAPQEPADILGDQPTPRYVHLSWLSNPATSMAFTWATRDSSAGSMTSSTIVEVCEDAAMTTGCLRVDNIRRGPGIGAVWHLPYSSAWKTIHKAEVCGLRPSTTYYYRVGGSAGGRDVFSTPAPFTTAPPAGTTPRFTFVAMGDSRGAPDRLSRTLATAIATEHPAFVSFGGDFIEDGTRQSEWDAVFEQCEEAMRSTPILPVPGNHEKAAVGFYAQFLTPGNQNYYALTYGNAVVVSLNDCWSGAGLMGTYGVACGGAMIQPGSARDEQAGFMDAVFGAAVDQPWRFVVHHRPIYSETSDLTHGGTFNSDLKSAWAPVFDRNRVTMVFNGHDHYYQRSVPIRGDRAAAGPLDGVNYVVTAGAGATLYDVRTTSMVAATRSAIHYTAVTIEGPTLHFAAVELNRDTGAVIGTIDTLDITR